MNKRETIIRTIFAFLGVSVLALGVTVLQAGNVGLDPYTSANTALGHLFGLSLGVYQLLINIVILIFIFFFNKKYIGIGTIVNMVLTGFLIDIFSSLFENLGWEATTFLQQAIFLVIGTLIFTFGASLYMAPELGNAPYDAIAPVIVERTKMKYRVVRVIQDVLFATIGFIFGGPIGVGTFVSAFLTGPFISFWDKNVTKPIVKKSVEKFGESKSVSTARK